jgi:MFS family permease
VLSILPLLSTLIVAGGFDIIVEIIDYDMMFLALGIVISISGALGLFIVKDSSELKKCGSFSDIIYGFKPSTVKSNLPLYAALAVVCIFSVACQIYMPFLIIYMKTYLGFTVVEYSVVFGAAILFAAAINIFLGIYSDKKDKIKLMYAAAAIYSAGLFCMFLANGMPKVATLVFFGLSGFVMLTGFIFITSLAGAVVRDNTPADKAGKLQGVRMIFAVLIPMLAGPAIGNAINAAANVPLSDAGADAMTTQYIPSPFVFLAGSLVVLLVIAVLPILSKLSAKKDN